MNEQLARRIVRDRADGRCELCRREATNWAHRKGRGQGGAWTPSNGLLLCGSGTTGCHGWTHANRTLAAAGGWIVESGEPPENVPVWLVTQFGALWVLLDDAGSLEPLWDREDVPELPPWVTLRA